MKSAIAYLVGSAPYSQSRYYSEAEVPKEDNGKEGADVYERRTWRHRLHRTPDGLVQIPGQAFANSIKQAAKHLRLKVRGMGNSEYTKHFEAGVMVPENLVLPSKDRNTVRVYVEHPDELTMVFAFVLTSLRRVKKMIDQSDGGGFVMETAMSQVTTGDIHNSDTIASEMAYWLARMGSDRSRSGMRVTMKA